MKFLSLQAFTLLIFLYGAISQSVPDYLVLIGPDPTTQLQIDLPISQFTTSQYSVAFWFRIYRAFTQKLISHSYTSSSTTSSQGFTINYIANSNNISMNLSVSQINQYAWNFAYVGIDCANSKSYMTTIMSGVDFTETADISSASYTGICFTNTLSTLKLTVGDSTLATSNMGRFANFRYFTSTLLTKNSMMRYYIVQEIDPWLWLRFSPSETNQTVQKIRDYARANLVLKGFGYNQESNDSVIPLIPNTNYTYGNFFTDNTYTTASMDYLGPSFTLTLWFALDPRNPDASQTYFIKIEDTDYPQKSRLWLGISPIDTASLQYNILLNISNETSQMTFQNSSTSVIFATSSDSNVTEWLLLILKLEQFNQITPNFFSLEVYDKTGSLRMSYQDKAVIAFTGENPMLQLGGFNGYMTDVRAYKGAGLTLTPSNYALSTILPSCTVAIGSQYQNLTVNSSNTAITSTITCLSCVSGTFSQLEIPLCSNTCPIFFESDSTTNLCKCASGDCLSELQCHPTCRRCDAISPENCRTCSSFLFLSPSPRSCGSTCPTNYCAIYDLTKGGVCTLCEQFESGAYLTVVNGSFIQLHFTNNMNITGDLGSMVTIKMAEYSQSTDYDVTFEKVSNKTYNIWFTYHMSLPLRSLKLAFNDPTQLLDQNGYHLSQDYALITADLPGVFSPTQEQLDRNEKYRDWALYIIYFMVASFPILLQTGDAGIFWGIIDSAQILNYLLYINFTSPSNVQNFLAALSIANVSFIPNIIWKILTLLIVPIDLEDQGAPSNLVSHGILYVNFLYNAGRVLFILIALGFFYLIIAILNSINFQAENKKAIIKKARGWMIFMIIRTFLVGYLQLVFAVVLQIVYPSYKDVFSMISVVLAMVFGVFVIWLPINIIIGIEKTRKIQIQTGQEVDSYLKRIFAEYRFDYFFSRNFVFFLLIRNIALVLIIILLPTIPLTQSGVFLNVSLLVSLWIAAMPIYRSASYTIINLVALGGFGIIGVVLFWMIGNNTFNDQAQLAENNYEIGEIMEITSLIVLFMYALAAILRILQIAWRLLIKLKADYDKRKAEKNDEMGIDTVNTENSKHSKSGLELVKSRSARSTRFNDSLFSQDSSMARLSRRNNSRAGYFE